ncbi:hypothetical protein JCGZ_02246 [Jatropha curcas]|uniref:Uncharacterized protein n=1 Tax=Jatropha curcas TaxID=180498 RepID=A0A067KZ87_JATCU|nr:hypothetical protein JCGZ_02246 [Jatropha curcas]
MGNEMGNNNTSGLQEEYNASNEAEQKSAQEPSVHANDVKGENHQKETGFASDDPKGVGDTPAYDQTSDIVKGQEKTDVSPPVESPKADKKLHEEVSEDGDFQLAASLSKESEDPKIKVSSENVLEMSNNGTGNSRQSSLGKEQEDMLNSTSVLISSSHDPESEDSAEPNSDQHQFKKVHAEESEEDNTNSSEGIEDVLGSNIACNSKEGLLDNHISGRIEETFVSDTKTDMAMKKDSLLEKEMAFEVEFGNGDIREKYDGELDSKVNCYGTDSLESQLEANLGGDSLTFHLEDKCMVIDQESELVVNKSEVVLDQETELIVNESEVVLDQETTVVLHQETELTVNESEVVLDQETTLIVNESTGEEDELHPESVGESEIHMQNASQTDSLTRLNRNEGSLFTVHDAASNGNCYVEEVKVVDESNNQNEASEEHLEGSEGKIMMAYESREFQAEAFILNGKSNEQESGDCIPEAYPARDAASNKNYQVAEANGVEEPGNQNEASEGKLVMVPENEIKESGDCIPEAHTACDAATNNNYQVVEANGVEEPDNQNEASEGKLVMVPEIEIEESGDCIPEAYTACDAAINTNYQVVEANGVEESYNQNEASEGKLVMVPEIEIKESGDCIPEAYTACDAATNNNYQVVAANGVEESYNQNEASEGKLVMVPEIEIKQSGDCIPEAYSNCDAATKNNYQVVEANGVGESDNQNEASEGKLVMVPEIEIKRSGDCIPEAYTACDAATNNNYQVVEANGVEESDNQNEASEGKLVMVPEIEIKQSGDCIPEAYTACDAATNNNYQVVEANGVEESDNQNEDSEGKLVMVPEIEIKESGDCIPEIYACDAATKNNYQVVEANGVEESDNQNEASEGKLVMIPEIEITAAKSSIANGRNNEELEDCKSEACEGKSVLCPQLATATAELPIKNEEESDDCKAAEEVPEEKQTMEIKEKTETECSLASTHLCEDNQQTPEEVQGGNSEFFTTTASVFHASSSLVETFVSAVELELEKPVEEVLPNETQTNPLTTSSANHSMEQPENVEIPVIVINDIEPIPQTLIQAESQNFPTSTIKNIVSAAQQEQSPHCSTAVKENQPTEEIEKAETSLFARASHELQETVGRFSTESIPDGLNMNAEMRKSPSFNLNLRIEARSEESDMTPLLCQDKNTIEGLSNQNQASDGSLQDPLLQAQYGQGSDKCQEMPAEEKVITLERSDSEKSRTPFLGFLKEDEEPHHLVVIPKKKDKKSAAKKGTKDQWNSSCNKEITPTPAKSKHKHKRRSSLFTNCMCCTTVIN